MKKSLFILTMLFLNGIFAYAQSAAFDFTANDCAGSSHTLFTELNAGKVIVIAWVMPCATCIGPSRNAYDIVQTYATSNPGRVLFYLMDENEDCSTLTDWGSTNQMPNAIKFSTTTANLSNYGTTAMPKIIVLGSASHLVYYKEDGTANPSGLQPAINQALAASGIDNNKAIVSELKIVSNGNKNNGTLIYSLTQPNSVSIEITDVTGKKVKTFSFANQASGKHETPINLDNTNEGMYFLTFNSGGTSSTIKFIISH